MRCLAAGGLAATVVMIALIAALHGPVQARVVKAKNLPAAPADSIAYAICHTEELTMLCELAKTAADDSIWTQTQDPTLVATLYAPTNKAFDSDARLIEKRLGKTYAQLLQDPPLAAALLKNHLIIGQALQTGQLSGSEKYQSALGQTLSVDLGFLWGSYIKSANNKVKVVKPNILAGRSYIQEVDGVLVPKL